MPPISNLDTRAPGRLTCLMTVTLRFAMATPEPPWAAAAATVTRTRDPDLTVSDRHGVTVGP
jgi:hypothetical protein